VRRRAASRSRNAPPSENESGVTFRMPITCARPGRQSSGRPRQSSRKRELPEGKRELPEGKRGLPEGGGVVERAGMEGGKGSRNLRRRPGAGAAVGRAGAGRENYRRARAIAVPRETEVPPDPCNATAQASHLYYPGRRWIGTASRLGRGDDATPGGAAHPLVEA